MIPHFEYPKGYKIVKDPVRSIWRKAIYEFTLDDKYPLTYVDKNGISYRPDRHFFTDQGSVPTLLQLFVPKDRFVGFYFHDSMFIHGGMYINEPQWEMKAEVDKDGMLSFVPKFVFKKYTRAQANQFLRDMVPADPDKGWQFTANGVWLGVTIGGLWTHYDQGTDSKFRMQRK